MTARDEDISDTLVYEILQTDSFFIINRDNGMIHTRVALNREASDFIILNISVTDGLHTVYTRYVYCIIQQYSNII